jgi:hypothetical protein
VHGVEVDSDAVRLEHADQLIGDLDAHSLLNGETPREHAHESGQL